MYRLVRTVPPTDVDFRSYRAESPHRVFPVSECQARGLSVYGERRDCELLRKLAPHRNKRVCVIRLVSGAGWIQPTGKPSHHTWWPFAAFDISAHCEAVAS